MTVFLQEMTTTEAAARLAQTDICYIPTGTVEGHGSHMPLGCDTYVATAVSKLLAEREGGVVLPPLWYNFCGGTASFPGTISVPIETQEEVLREIIRAAYCAGARRIFVVSIHGPNTIPVGHVIRGLYESDGIVAMMLAPYGRLDEQAWRERIAGFDGPFKEACMLYGSLQVLGLAHLVPDTSTLESVYAESEGQGVPEEYAEASSYGSAGFRYTSVLQHQPPRAGLSARLGIEMLEEVVESLRGAPEALARYLEYVERTGVHHRVEL
jgi:hypothetical protein